MKKSKSQTPNQETPLLLPIVTSMHPFENDCEHFVVGSGEYILPEDANKVFEKTIGLPANKSRLKAFLSQECNILDPTHYSFPDIIAALRLYIERSCGENSVDKSLPPKEGATEGSTEEKKQSVPTKEPSKKAQQAYKLYYGGTTQQQVAENMTRKLGRPVSQGQVSRWLKQYREWRKAEGIPVDDKKANIITSTAFHK